MASISSCGARWAAIRAMTPVPVPMSRARLSEGSRVIAAPSSTASVPTFSAALSLRIENCLNLNESAILHREAAVAESGESGVVGNDDYGLPRGVPEVEEQLVDLLPGHGVQVAGGFVGE